MDNVREVTIIDQKSSILISDKNGFVIAIIPRKEEFKKDIFPLWGNPDKLVILE